MSQQTIEMINLISSVSSITLGPLGIILAILAFIQAGFYYLKSKDTETELKKQLAIMSCQNDMIKEVINNLLSKTIKTISHIAQNPAKGPADQLDATKIIQLVEDLAKKIQPQETKNGTQPDEKNHNVIRGHNLPNLPDPLSKECLKDEAISAVGQVFIFAGLSNIYAQYLLPAKSEFEEKNKSDPNLPQTMKIVNMCFETCQNAYNWLLALKDKQPSALGGHKLLPHILQYEAMFKTQVRNADNALEYWESLKKEQSL